MDRIRVVVSGTGKMGRQVGATVADDPGLELVGYVDGLAQAGHVEGMPVFRDPRQGLREFAADVVIDFTNAAWTPELASAAMAQGTRLVIGTTGLSADFISGLDRDCRQAKLGSVVAANFAIGAILMMHFARQAARFFDNAEIIELHHDQKVDAPSGTAKTTAEMMAAARKDPFVYPPTEKETIPGSRGARFENLAIHSVRLPGLVAHQEVIFGGLGQTLTIRHDTTGRDSFMPGVLAATRAVMSLDHLVIGLDALFGLSSE